MSNDFDKYLAIANHDIQMAIDDVQLKSYVASILYDNDKKVNMLNEKDKEIERLNNNIKEVLEYLDISNMSFVDKNEIAIRLKGSDKE